MTDPEFELCIIANNFANKKDLIIFDIGAYDFWHSRLFKSNFHHAYVYAFEPDINNIEKYASIHNNDRIIISPIAVSDVDDFIRFYPSTELAGKSYQGSGSILKPVVRDNTNEGKYHNTLYFDLNGYEVQSMRIDTFCKKFKITHIDYMHIDVQGAEMKVMKGLGNIRPKFIFAETCEFETYESNITYDDFNVFMNNLGYDVIEKLTLDTVYKLRD